MWGPPPSGVGDSRADRKVGFTRRGANLSCEVRRVLRTVRTEPEIVYLPDVTVAVLHAVGDPGVLGPRAIRLLCDVTASLKVELKRRGFEMTIGMPRARWQWSPQGAQSSRTDGAWALPVPDDVSEELLARAARESGVGFERWAYGSCARILHTGDSGAEEPTVRRLLAFIDESGYETTGLHEEWYLSQPGSKSAKTVILYPVRKRD
jgi:hypothetical protein